MDPPPGEDDVGQSLGPRDRLDALLQEYSTVRAQADQALGGQLTALSVGFAATAILLAGVASLWSKAAIVACIGLMAAIPGAFFFVLLLWATEIKKTLRASSFLRRVVEPAVDDLFAGQPPVLRWERNGYAYGRLVPYYLTIAGSLIAAAWATYAAGAVRFETLHRDGVLWFRGWPVVIGAITVLAPTAVAVLSLRAETRANLAERKPVEDTADRLDDVLPMADSDSTA
jgi:hypothetical protein